MPFDKVKYNNNYNKNNYDRITVNVPKGKRQIIEEHCKSNGYTSVNAYINRLIENDINMRKMNRL